MRTLLVLVAALAACAPTPTAAPMTTPAIPPAVARPGSSVPLESHIVPPDSAVILALEPAQLDTGGITSFSLLSARDLIVRVVLPRLDDGVTFVTVTLGSPDGTQFFTMRTAFSTDPSTTQVDEPGAAHPFDVEHPTGATLLHLDMYVPIAGTDLVRKSRPGTWEVEARVDGERPFVLSAPVDTTMTM